MIAVGILGFPFIGALQEKTATAELSAGAQSGLVAKITSEKEYVLGKYQAIDPDKAAALTDPAEVGAVASANQSAQFSALGTMAFFPAFMLICYLALFFYFKSRGGYSAQVLTGHKANDDKFTGGVPGSASF